MKSKMSKSDTTVDTYSTEEEKAWPPKPMGQPNPSQRFQKHTLYVIILGWTSFGLSLTSVVFGYPILLIYISPRLQIILLSLKPFLNSCGPTILMLFMPLLSIILSLFSRRYLPGKIGGIVATIFLITVFLWPVHM